MKEIEHKIAKSILKISPICSNSPVIFESAIGSVIVVRNLYVIQSIANLKIGAIHIPITIITPTKPIAFLRIIPPPKTVSTASPNIFPTTGTAELTIAFVVLAVIPSTLLDIVPSNETTPTNIVRIIPKNQTIPDFKNFDNLLICILSVNFDKITKLVKISTSGNIIVCMILPIKLIINSIIGSIIPLVAILPVYIMRVIKSGTSIFINATKSVVVCFTIVIISEKFDITIVTINMYWT